jgi:PAS domain S-box-containing protein
VRRPGRGLLIPGIIFVILAVVVALLGWAIFEGQASDMRRESSGALLAVQKVQSEQVSRWFVDELHDAMLLGSAPALTEGLGRYIDQGASGPLPSELVNELELYRLGHDITSISVLDTSLRTVAVSPESSAAASDRDQALAAKAVAQGRATFSDLYVRPGGAVVMDFAAPVRRETASRPAYVGAIVLHQEAESVLFPLLQAWPPSLRTGESVLAVVRGDRVISLNPLRLTDTEPLSLSRPLTDTDLPVVMAARGRHGIVQGVDYRGEPVLAAVGKVPGTPWYLVAKQDVAVIDQPVRDRGLATLAWVVGLVVLAGVVILLYWRGRETRGLRELVAVERERGRAEARYAALMQEAKEIVLLLDRENRIVEANDYALATYGYSRDQLIGKDADIFLVPQMGVTVADRTRQLDEAGGHLTFESLHRRSDAVEFPVEVRLSYVSIEGEEYLLEVVRDIGERKAADAALRDSEARYRTLFENALSGFALHEIVLDEAGVPVDFVILAANPAFETQTGLAVADLVGRRGLDVIPGLAETGLVERFGRVALTGEPERFETYASHLGRHLDQQVVSPRRGQFALLVLDTTERREAEEIVSGFFGSSPVGLFILDRELRYVRVNETLAALNGVTADEHIGKTVRETVPLVADALGPAMREVIETGDKVHRVEITGESPASHESRSMMVSVFPITALEGRVEFVGGVVVDITPVKRAERELEENKAFLERVLGVTPDLIYIFDIVEQRNVFSNREMLDVLGFSPEDILAMGSDVLPRILHPDDRELMAGHHLRARSLADGDVLEVEYRMRHANGEWRILHGRDTVFARDEGGEVTQLVGTAQDVTDQRHAEADLVRFSQRFEATVMASPLAIVALDAQGRVQLWNPAATAVFGWSAEESIGGPARFIPPESLEQAEALQRRLAAGEQFSGLDLPCVRKDGRRIHTSVSLALMRDEDAAPASALMIVEDVTERRANVVRLARLTRLYQVLSAVTETISEERDPEKLYEKVCRIVVEQGGFSLAWVGKKRRNGLVQVLAGAGIEGAAEEIAVDTRAPAGELSAVGVAITEGRGDTSADVLADQRMAPYRDHARKWGLRSVAAVPIVIDGRHDHALAIYSSEPGRFDAEEVALLERLAADVGFAIEAAGKERARRKAERQLEALNADLERRVRARTDALEDANAELESFSYSVSHDLRAPLRALDGFSLALLEDYGDRLDGEAADYLGRIRGASQRMARLIDDLLMLSRVTRRGMTWEQVDLSALARAIGRELADDQPGRQVTLTIMPKMAVDGDAQLLDVALRNLLGNAWKFTARTAGAQVDVGMETHGEDRVFFVRDNGAGFDAQYADKLFVPFQRLHDDDEFPGTGIGLATVQRIVRRHGGRVWADGATGMGATVWFTLESRGVAE